MWLPNVLPVCRQNCLGFPVSRGFLYCFIGELRPTQMSWSEYVKRSQRESDRPWEGAAAASSSSASNSSSTLTNLDQNSDGSIISRFITWHTQCCCCCCRSKPQHSNLCLRTAQSRGLLGLGFISEILNLPRSGFLTMAKLVVVCTLYSMRIQSSTSGSQIV